MNLELDPASRVEVGAFSPEPGASEAADSTAVPIAPPGHARERWTALAEVVLCSGFPTQIFLIMLLGGTGLTALDGRGQLSFAYIVTLSLADAALVLGLVFALLTLHAQSPWDVFVGRRPWNREALMGVLLVPVTVTLVLAGLGFIQLYAPWLHNVTENPLEVLIRTPRDAAVFTVVAILAGGVREELQRAFVLNRFERHLGGGTLGLVIFSIAFGMGHIIQGWDAAIMTGLLGVFWGSIYLARGSVVAPLVCHAGFNVAEIARHLATS